MTKRIVIEAEPRESITIDSPTKLGRIELK